jgi:hypothetical protein
MRFFQAEKVGNGTPVKISRRRRRGIFHGGGGV